MNSFKSGVLVSATQSSGSLNGYKNMGDYVQSLAQDIFINDNDVVYVDKEKISSFKSKTGKVKTIMNAWWMVYPENWPPSEDIEPLLISMHISPTNAEKMLTEEGLEFFKRFGPVGCRDMGTVEILKKRNVPCYFSGCLTLALGMKYKTEKTNNDIFFVDPYCETVRNSEGNISLPVILGNIFSGIKNFSKLKKINHRFNHYFCLAGRFVKLKRFLVLSSFYRTYSEKFDDEVLFNAKYIAHSLKIGEGTQYDTEERKMKYTEDLIKLYAEASLVVTSRIHCALPCLGLETPVIFVHSGGAGHVRDPGRFGGIVELFNVMQYKNFSLISEGNDLPGKIRMKTKIKNKDNYVPLMNEMIRKSKEFFNKD